MQKKLLKLIAYICYALLVFLAAIVLLSFFSVSGFKLFSVESGSMAPKIRTGDLIGIYKSQNYKVDDVITFHNPTTLKKNDLITHRIVAISEEGISTKGDANNSNDIWRVQDKDIAGEYLFRIPYLGYATAYMRTIPGLILLVIIPGTIVIYEESKKIHHETKKIIVKRRKSKNKNDELEKIISKLEGEE